MEFKSLKRKALNEDSKGVTFSKERVKSAKQAKLICEDSDQSCKQISREKLNNNKKMEPLTNLSSNNLIASPSRLFKNPQDYVMDDNLLNKSDLIVRKKSIKKLRKLKKIQEMKSHSLPAKHPDAEKRTIFIGNVNVTAKKKKLQKFFSQYGSIESTRYRGIAAETMDMSKKEAITQHKLHPDRKTVIAYIRFENESSKKNALEANGVEFEGLHLRVDDAMPKPISEKNSIFIGNLPFEVEDEDLWKLFRNCGEIESVRIVRSSLTGAGKGFGFVNFKSKDSIEMAFQLDGELLKNRSIRVKRMAKKGKELKPVKTKKSATSSLVNTKNPNKMKLSFMKHDKPRFQLESKNKKKKDIFIPDLEFAGAKIAEDGKIVNKKRKPRRSKQDKRNIALSKIVMAKSGMTK